MARYNPRGTPAFWQRMQNASPGKERPPVFLSTHPNKKRISHLERILPKAMEYYHVNN